MKIFRQRIMGLNLGSHQIWLQAHMFDESSGKAEPIQFRISNHMSCPGAGGAAKLAHQFVRFNLVYLPLQTVAKDGHFLAESGRGCGLAMGQSQHGNLFVAFTQALQLFVDRKQLGKINLF